MVKFVYQQTIIQWRIPIKEDGSLGNPEIMKKFTSEWGGSQNNHKKKRVIKKLQSEELGEVLL